MRIYALCLFLLSSAVSALPEQNDSIGYIFYAKSGDKVGSTSFAPDDAILIKPKLKRVISDRHGLLTAEVEFKKMEGVKADGPWQDGVIHFGRWKRNLPVSQMDPAQFTTEPGQDHSSRKPVNTLFCGKKDKECKIVMRLIADFHNSEFCDRINRATAGSRRDRFLEGWVRFIKKKSKDGCPKKSKTALCRRLRRARDTDITARAAVFESLGLGTMTPAPAADARHACEEDVIMLTIRNLALDSDCKNPRRHSSKKSGCKYLGDFTDVATNPNEFNIWVPEDTLTTRITGCFLRDDLETVHWTNSPFLLRKRDFVKTLPRAYAMTNPRAKMRNFFHIERKGAELSRQEELRLINHTKYYYHPIGMEKCDPKSYDRTVFVGTAYAHLKDGDYLLSGMRFVPAGRRGKSSIKQIYRPEIRGQRYGPDEAWDKFFASLESGKVKEAFIDRKRANVCWPAAHSGCQLDKEVGYRKAPKWAITKKNEGYRVSCRARDGSGELTWTWRGTCDPKMVVVPEINRNVLFD